MKDKNRYNVVNNREEETRTVIVHTFNMGDVEDPDIYAADPLLKWQNSQDGQWVMKNAVECPSWHRTIDPLACGYRYTISAKLSGPTLTEWLLRQT
jgi:hypothetical protein